MLEDQEVNLITNMGISTGIGRYASELERILSPLLPKLKLYSLNYFQNSTLPNSTSISHYFANNLFQVPIVNWRNTRRAKKEKIFEDSNLHLLGADYSLVNESKHAIMTVHEFYFLVRDLLYSNDLKEAMRDLGYNYGLLRLRKYARLAKRLVSPSYYTASQVKSHLGVNPVVIHETVDKARFHLRDKAHVRNRLGLPQEKLLILNVSGGGSNKNLRTLSKIANMLPPNFLLVKINHPLKSANTIDVGMVDDSIYPYYFSASDIYLNTSINEGFCLPLIESMSSGLPIVTNRKATAEEILSRSGVYVGDPLDPEGYLEQIVTISDLRELKQLADSVQERCEAFSDEVARHKLMQLYKDAFE